MTMWQRRLSQRKQGGIALIEALIAIFLFSLGILALVGLQTLMTKNVTQAKLRGEAAFLASQLIGQMWVIQPLTNFVVEDNECAVSAPNNCDKWLAAVGQVLPSGEAEVTVNGTSVGITLSWQLPGEEPSRFQIDADINN
jgi:type IV pilus assembly protein PilV